jgi:hypothetical protein
MGDVENTAGEEAVETGASTLIDVLGHGVEAVGGWAVNEVAAVGETAYHAGSGVVNMVQGDWDDAAKDMTEMSSAAINFLTGGISGAAETGYDVGVAATGGGPGAHEQENNALKAAGEWLGDQVYDLTHSDEL